MFSWATRSKESSRVGEGGGVADLERDPPLGVEADLGHRRVHHLLGDVDATHPCLRELAGEEQRAGAGAAADIEDPLGRRGDAQARRRPTARGARRRRRRCDRPIRRPARRRNGAPGRAEAARATGARAAAWLTARPISQIATRRSRSARSTRQRSFQLGFATDERGGDRGAERSTSVWSSSASFALVAVAIVAVILIGRGSGGSELDRRRRLQGSRTAGTEDTSASKRRSRRSRTAKN